MQRHAKAIVNPNLHKLIRGRTRKIKGPRCGAAIEEDEIDLTRARAIQTHRVEEQDFSFQGPDVGNASPGVGAVIARSVGGLVLLEICAS